MTQNQIRYWEYLESKRHNVETESAQSKQAEAALQNAATNRADFELRSTTEPIKAQASYLSSQAAMMQAETARSIAPSTIYLNYNKAYETRSGTLDYFLGITPQSNAIVKYTYGLLDSGGSGKTSPQKGTSGNPVQVVSNPTGRNTHGGVVPTPDAKLVYRFGSSYQDKVRTRNNDVMQTFLQY